MRDLIKVDWVDSYGATSRWSAVEDIKPIELRCVSVGYNVFEDDNVISIAPHFAIETSETVEQCNGVMTIPKRSIIKIANLINAK